MNVSTSPWVPSPYQRAPKFLDRIKNLQASGPTTAAVRLPESARSLEEELFNSLSTSARWVSLLSMHLTDEWRRNIVSQLQRLLSFEAWDDDCNLLSEASTRSFLRFIIFGSIQVMPMLGISNRRRLTASWTWDKHRRLNMEFMENDRCRMVFSYPGEFETVRQAMDGNIGDAVRILSNHNFDLAGVPPS